LYLQETPDEELERTLVTNFQNEAIALDRVRHPNVISRLGHGTAIDLDGTTFHYLVLEYLPGGDLAALARRSPLPIERTFAYLEQVCAGLSHAHQVGIIHRDIKPQNLLLSSDRRIVKIADFGVARLEATEGAITRVGTNIYSAPEHNPLVHTGQLDPAAVTGRDLLLPAADIYSLAKTTYTLLAGEPPRRFAHHPITSPPEKIKDERWADAVLKVLEKATQTRPESRHQTVENYWEELTAAVLAGKESAKIIAADLLVANSTELDTSATTSALTEPTPPEANFEVVSAGAQENLRMETARRPRIVVPFGKVRPGYHPHAGHQNAYGPDELVQPFPGQLARESALEEESRTAGRGRRFLVALLLVLAFSGMLLATHKYVTSQWSTGGWIPQFEEPLKGREGQTTTDVNLRPDPSTGNAPIGIAEAGSRVRILNISNNWFEVEVLQHGRTKVDPFSSDRGWINKRFVRFD